MYIRRYDTLMMTIRKFHIRGNIKCLNKTLANMSLFENKHFIARCLQKLILNLGAKMDNKVLVDPQPDDM